MKKLMYAAAADEEFSESEVEGIMKWLVDTVRAKTWNCDIEATKEYYMKDSKEHMIRNNTMKKAIKDTTEKAITTIGFTTICTITTYMIAEDIIIIITASGSIRK